MPGVGGGRPGLGPACSGEWHSTDAALPGGAPGARRAPGTAGCAGAVRRARPPGRGATSATRCPSQGRDAGASAGRRRFPDPRNAVLQRPGRSARCRQSCRPTPHPTALIHGWGRTPAEPASVRTIWQGRPTGRTHADSGRLAPQPSPARIYVPASGAGAGGAVAMRRGS